MKFLFCAFWMVFLSSCNEPSYHEEHKQDSVEGGGLERDASDIELIAEFNHAFNIRHQTLLRGKARGTAIWSGKALIYDRYVFIMRIPVKDAGGGRMVQSGGEVEIYILEIDNVRNNNIRYTKNQRRISLSEWKKLMKSDMNFSVINYFMKVDKPVPGLRAIFPAV